MLIPIERANQFRAECEADLALAKRVGHRQWEHTLEKRLLSLNKLIFGKKVASKMDLCLLKGNSNESAL